MKYLPRHPIEPQILEAALARSPGIQIVEAPRGAGKSALLRQVASRLAAQDRLPVRVDIEPIATGPADFARHFPTAFEKALHDGGILSPRAREIRGRLAEEMSRRRPDPVLLLDLALSFPEAAAESSRHPIVLLLDELGEIARLARHAGLRDAMNLVARRMAGWPARAGIAIVAAASPASRPARLLAMLRGASAGAMTVRPLPPLSDAETAALLRLWGREPAGDQELEMWMRATGGHPLHVEILARRVAGGEDLLAALVAEMTPHTGVLHQECRFDYHLLVERSRGHSVVRAILALLARQEGANLSSIAGHLRIQLPTALDYLSWLLEVGLIRRNGSGYVFADPLLRLWVRLNGPDSVDPVEEVAAFLETPRAAPLPPSRPRGRRPRAAPSARVEPPAPPPDRREFMIEID